MNHVHDELTAIIPGAWLAKAYVHIAWRTTTRHIPIGGDGSDWAGVGG